LTDVDPYVYDSGSRHPDCGKGQALSMTSEQTEKPGRKPRIRDAEATKARILEAAKKEFAKNGLGGARVDVIAEKAKANKRMIYHYFESKEGLFQTIMEEVYLDIRSAEQKLHLEDLAPKAALEKLVRFTWEYYLKNPEFLTLVNSENLHRAKHLKKSKIVTDSSRKLVSMVASLLERGVKEGVFRDEIDPVQLNITIAAVGYYYLTNRFTGTIIYEQDLMAKEALERRIQFNIETIMRLVCA
jgi:AcrR family transcriptional regulator